MAIIKIKKNSPKLNSYGQYRFTDGSDGINELFNLSISGDVNTKFLDDDLYTTNLGNKINEDILINKYNLSQQSSLKLSLDISSNNVNYRITDIIFRVAIMEDDVALNTFGIERQLSDENGCKEFSRA